MGIGDSRMQVDGFLAHARATLKKSGGRWTPQRENVLRVLPVCEKHATVEVILEKVRRYDRQCSIATIYRTLKDLLKAGLVRRVEVQGKPAFYTVIDGSTTKGHQLIYTDDIRVDEMTSPALDDVLRDLLAERGLELASGGLAIPVRRRRAAGKLVR